MSGKKRIVYLILLTASLALIMRAAIILIGFPMESRNDGPVAPLEVYPLKMAYKERPAGGLIEQTYTFKNNSDTDITIKGIKRSCGCDKLSWDKATLEPGEKKELIAKYLVRPGRFMTSLAVIIDCPEKPIVVLSTSGVGKEDFRVMCREERIQIVLDSEGNLSADIPLHIYSTSKTPLKIQATRADGREVRVHQDNQTAFVYRKQHENWYTQSRISIATIGDGLLPSGRIKIEFSQDDWDGKEKAMGSFFLSATQFADGAMHLTESMQKAL